MPSFGKRQRSATALASTAVSPTTPDQTLPKKPRVALPASSMPLKGKAGAAASRAIAGSSRPIPLNSRPSQVEFPPFDKIWLVFGDIDSSQYLKNATTHEEYARLVKYFHGRLVLVVRGFISPKSRLYFVQLFRLGTIQPIPRYRMIWRTSLNLPMIGQTRRCKKKFARIAMPGPSLRPVKRILLPGQKQSKFIHQL